jgi:hypothetical protein
MKELKYNSRLWRKLSNEGAWRSGMVDGKRAMIRYNNEYYYLLPNRQ